MTDERRGAAFHEAGHAVVAWCLRLQVDSIAIGLCGDDTKGRTCIASDQSHLPIVDRLALCLAGLDAEEFFDAPTHEYAGVHDLDRAREIIVEDTLEEDTPEHKIRAHLKHGYARARKMIAENETRCRRLAACLEERGQVSAGDFRGLMEGE